VEALDLDRQIKLKTTEASAGQRSQTEDQNGPTVTSALEPAADGDQTVLRILPAG
jgi:hypothetical protein